MADDPLQLTEGWTERIVYQLTKEIPQTPQLLTGVTVALILKDKHGNIVTPAGTVGVEDVNLGKVYFDPGPNDLLNSKSPYEAHWKATDINSKSAFFPQGEGVRWNVAKQ